MDEKEKEKRDIKHLGQVFTPDDITDRLIGLRKNEGKVLEPSCGNGAISDKIPGCTAIECDKNVAPKYADVMDFFDYGEEKRFDTIIGNPPYVRYRDILPETKKKLDMSLFDERSNLYLFFIEKCIRLLNPGGELIFIVPRDFMKSTSAMKLNAFLYKEGTITDLIDMGDKKVFPGASPNTVIFRFEKGNFNRKTRVETENSTEKEKTFSLINGQLLFLTKKYTVPFSELFFVKVGAVSGADKIFESKNGNMEFVCSTTRATGNLRRMYYDVKAPELAKHKEELLRRKVRHFDENSWYEWGRRYFVSDSPRIYVNAKTRQKDPFFFSPCMAYDGSVLAVFPKFKASPGEIKEIVSELNRVDWGELGFVCGGRYLFSQKALENTVLPEAFERYKKKGAA